MEPSPQHPEAEPVSQERWIVELTGMTQDAARTFLEFHSGLRWLRRPD
jgi:hypothetical protein